MNPLGGLGKRQVRKLKIANQWKLNIPIGIHDVGPKRQVFVL